MTENYRKVGTSTSTPNGPPPAVRTPTFPTLDVLSRFNSPDERTLFDSSPYVDAGCLDDYESALPSSPIFEEVIKDHDGINLTVMFDSEMETLPITPVLAYYTQYPEPLNAQRILSLLWSSLERPRL